MTTTPASSPWVAEIRMLSLCDVTRAAFQGWDRAGLFPRDPGGAYGIEAVIEVALLKEIREVIGIEELVGLWKNLREDDVVEQLVRAADDFIPGLPFDLIVDPINGSILHAVSKDELVAAVRLDVPRTVAIRPMAARLKYVIDGFHRFATTAERPTIRKAGRPPRGRVADVRRLRAVDG